MYKALFVSVLFIAAFCFGCSSDGQRQSVQEWNKKNGKIKVLSTIAMINDLVTAVGGDHIDAITLIKGELDPHSYQLVKGDDEKLSAADVIFANGLGLEHGPSLQAYLNNHKNAVGLGSRIMDDDPTLLLYFRGQPDPHIWMDISLWSKAVPHIVEVLSNLDPTHAEEYYHNGEKLMRQMEEENERVTSVLHEIPPSKRYLVTSHDAFNYFTRAYLAEPGERQPAWRERFAAPEGLAPDSQIGTADIQSIIDHLKTYNVHVIFPESNVSRDSIRKIVQAAKEVGLNVRIADVSLYADAIGKPGSDGDTYLKMMNHNARIISENLKHNGG